MELDMPTDIDEHETLDASQCHQCLPNAQFSHAVTERQLIETHISCIFLTGEFAYKVKKNINLGFVDYSTLEKRKHFCELEVELNRRFAPNIYLGVVAVYETLNGLQFGSSEISKTDLNLQFEIVDYAVKMRQFSQEAIVANRLDHDELTAQSVEDFGRYIAKFHARIRSADPTFKRIQPCQIYCDAIENFRTLLDPLANDPRSKVLEELEVWTHEKFECIQPKLQDRLEQGKVKRCHGDLHLKNVIQLDGKLNAFDGIEFSEKFQYVDVLSEVAFPVMDFIARGRRELGWRLLNAYLEATGEYDLGVLRFYLIYRAMVRAKVAWLNPANHTESRRVECASDSSPNDTFAGPWDKYIDVASYFAFELKPKLSITHGFSGSGKSTAAMDVIDAEGGIRIRSDVQRHRLARQFDVSEKYCSEMNELVYMQLTTLAKDVIKCELPIIIDAACLKQIDRQRFIELATELAVQFEIIECTAPVAELRRRLKSRTNDPSEANTKVLELQLANHDPLTQAEANFVLS